MKTSTSKLIIISICCSIFISCGGDANNDKKKETIYIKNDTLNVQRGDSIKSLSSDTKINIITDIESGNSKITVLSGAILLIKGTSKNPNNLDDVRFLSYSRLLAKPINRLHKL